MPTEFTLYPRFSRFAAATSGEMIITSNAIYITRRHGMEGYSSGATWGIAAQTGVLTDVLLGKPDHFRWVPLNSISAVTFANQEKLGYRFDQQKAMSQHR